MKLEIRRAHKNDKDLLLILRYFLRKFESEVEKTESCTVKDINNDKKILLHALNDKNVYFFIAYSDNLPTGYSKLKIKKINNELIGHIGADFVLGEFRDKGIGKKLMEAMLDILKKKKIKKISVETFKTNKLSIKAHKKLGFRIVDAKPNSKLYRMEKNLK